MFIFYLHRFDLKKKLDSPTLNLVKYASFLFCVFLRDRSLVILPEIKVQTSLNARDLIQHDHGALTNNNLYRLFSWVIKFLHETSKPNVAICVIIIFTALYKGMGVLQKLVQELSNDSDNLYTCDTHELKVPTTSKEFHFKVTKMIVDEQDILVTAYINGSVYVWDLYSNSCQYYINRRYYLFI